MFASNVYHNFPYRSCHLLPIKICQTVSDIQITSQFHGALNLIFGGFLKFGTTVSRRVCGRAYIKTTPAGTNEPSIETLPSQPHSLCLTLLDPLCLPALGVIFILRKGVFRLFQTTHPPLYYIVSILTYHPKYYRRFFRNHLPPRKKKKRSVTFFYFLETILYQLLLKNDVW